MRIHKKICKSKPHGNPFQWFDDEFGRGSPQLTITSADGHFFVNWDGLDGSSDYLHFQAAHDCTRFDGILNSLFESLRNTKLITDKTVLCTGGTYGGFYYIPKEVAELVYLIVQDEFNETLKVMAKVYRSNNVLRLGETNWRDHDKLVGAIYEVRERQGIVTGRNAHKSSLNHAHET